MLNNIYPTWVLEKNLLGVVEVFIPVVPFSTSKAQLSTGHAQVSWGPVARICTHRAPLALFKHLKATFFSDSSKIYRHNPLANGINVSVLLIIKLVSKPSIFPYSTNKWPTSTNLFSRKYFRRKHSGSAGIKHLSGTDQFWDCPSKAPHRQVELLQLLVDS